MNKKTLPQMLAISLIAFLFLETGCATTKAAPSKDTQVQNHEEHHPDGTVAQEDQSQSNMGQGHMMNNGNMMGNGMMNGGMMNNGMMGKMDMSQMMGMMQQCQAMHKSHKMCDHQIMSQCQANMGKQQCMTMLKEAKKTEKSAKKKQ